MQPTALFDRNLFRLPKWRKDLKACRQKLEKGEYGWAHLAYTLWPDRVKKICKTEISIAIAYGLEDLCEVKAPERKAKRGKKNKEQMEMARTYWWFGTTMKKTQPNCRPKLCVSVRLLVRRRRS